MKVTTLAMALAAIGMSALGMNAASAQTAPASASPVQVLNLQYQPENNDFGDPGGNTVTEPGIMVTFKNVTSKPIHAVVFAITDTSGHQLGSVSRHGTFSPGVQITRYFGNVRLKDKDGVPAKASAVEVGYVDGTSWTAR